MSNHTELSVRVNVTLADFQQRIETQFKPALRAAITEVMNEFIADTADNAVIEIAEAGE